MQSASTPSPRDDLKARAAELKGRGVLNFYFGWKEWARSEQLPPAGDWTTWLLMGGRGSGKTRAGAEWVRHLAMEGVSPIALVGETMTEALAVMVRGESGLMRVHPLSERPTLRGMTLTWPNGSTAQILSASDPERFRGPQFAAAWCDELGCGAVDKGANQPNVFSDPKSVESGQPYFSTGTPDALAQRQFIRAQQAYWATPAHNPAGMVDTNRIYLWTWDARPYPAFPLLTDIWADGTNHATGHWLSGRLGGTANDELALAIARDYDVPLGEVSSSGPVIEGYRLGQAMTCRDALEPLLKTTGLVMRDRGAIDLALPGRTAQLNVDPLKLVDTDKPLLSQRRSDPGEVTGRLALSFADRQRDYQTSTVMAMRRPDGALASESSELVLPPSGARIVAERLLAGAGQELDTVDLVLPPSLAALEVGDLIEIYGVAGGPFQITELREGIARNISARAVPNPEPISTATSGPQPGRISDFATSLPVLALAHLPAVPGEDARSRLVGAAFAKPWPGSVTLSEAGTGKTVMRLTRRGGVGELLADFAKGPEGVWDRANTLDVLFYAGHPATGEPGAVLTGSNRLAVERDDGTWEIVGFADAELIGPGRYLLSRLLRGLGGTGSGAAASGRSAILLDSRVETVPVPAQWLSATPPLRSFAGATDLAGTAVTLSTSTAPLLPLPPVHLRAARGAGGDIDYNWVRRSRADDDGWAVSDAPLDVTPERYVLTIFDGSSVVRHIEATEPTAVYSLAEQTVDFGSPPTGFFYEVAQVSAVFGPGPAAGAFFHE